MTNIEIIALLTWWFAGFSGLIVLRKYHNCRFNLAIVILLFLCGFMGVGPWLALLAQASVTDDDFTDI